VATEAAALQAGSVAARVVARDANRAYQATRAYSTPPVFPEEDEQHTTSDYGLLHLAMTITKQPIFHAIIHLLLPSEAAFVLQCRKVFVVQVDRAAEVEVHRHLQALHRTRAAFPSPPPASKLRYLHYLQQLKEALVGRPPKGFRFAVTKAASERAPRSVNENIYEAAKEGNLDELLGLCKQWAGHPVIDACRPKVIALTRQQTRTFACSLALRYLYYLPNKYTQNTQNASCSSTRMSLMSLLP